jgi:hypothetical protein
MRAAVIGKLLTVCVITEHNTGHIKKWFWKKPDTDVEVLNEWLQVLLDVTQPGTVLVK